MIVLKERLQSSRQEEKNKGMSPHPFWKLPRKYVLHTAVNINQSIRTLLEVHLNSVRTTKSLSKKSARCLCLLRIVKMNHYVFITDGHVLLNSKRRLPFIVCRLKKTIDRFPFAENKRKFSVSVFPVCSNKRKLPISICSISVYVYVLKGQHIYINKYLCKYVSIYICCSFKRKPEAQAIFLNPFTVFSSCKWKFVVCLFVYYETNGSCPFAHGLNGITHLGYLYIHFALQDRFFSQSGNQTVNLLNTTYALYFPNQYIVVHQTI
jgi:hypothetical protein